MSERERWIVYPLLFLALGVALRDEIFNRTWSKTVVCEELVAVQENPLSPLDPSRIAAIGPKGRSIDEIAPTGQLRVDTVLARNVISENYTFRGGNMDLVGRVARYVLSTLRISSEGWSGDDSSVEDPGVETNQLVPTGEADPDSTESTDSEQPPGESARSR